MKAPDLIKFKTPRHSKKWYEIQRFIKFGAKHTKKKFRRKMTKLGYAVCPDCKGERVLKRKIKKLSFKIPDSGIRTRKSVCLRCRGKGIVDWVNRVTGGISK